MSRSCGYQCTASKGQFSNIWGSGSTVRVISESDFLECAPLTATSASTGAFEADKSIPVTYQNLNFTNGKGSKGAAIASTSDSGTTTGLYVSITGCGGLSSVYNKASGTCSFTSCNFYGNSNSNGVLYGSSYGMTVTECIFNGNPYSCGLSGSSRKFQFLNCWFTDSIPTGTLVSGNSGNVLGTTASHLSFIH
jgi:hypothetical protein